MTARRSTLEDYRRRMLAVLLHIQRHLDEELALEDLAAVACFSPFHFHRIFRGMVGESVKEHVRRLRLERAAGQLKHGEAPIVRIALDAGYESHEAFTRAFKAARGMAPSEFRARHGVAAAYRASGSSGDEPAASAEGLLPVEEALAMDVKITSMPPLRVAFVRHVGPYSECGAAWERLCARLGSEGYLGGDTSFLGVCYDDPEVTAPNKLRYDACVTIDDAFEASGEIGVQTIDGGDFAVVVHLGPFERIGETYAALLGRWLPRSGRELRSAPCVEEYFSDPETTEPEDYVTEIRAPLEPAARARSVRT